jgi:hypothetical protein
VTLRRCIPRRLVLVDAPRLIGAVVMTVSAADEGHHRTTDIGGGTGNRCNTGSAARACHPRKLPATLIGQGGEATPTLAAEIA